LKPREGPFIYTMRGTTISYLPLKDSKRRNRTVTI
jgi:hypothetical protein